jgi:two-component system, NarL family, nitrate/nitrite response regulator NarL
MPGSNGRIHVLIADDHPMFRDGLRKVLEAQPGFEVVGVASDGEQAVRFARRLKPDVVLLDFAIPWRAGWEALKGLSSLPSVRIIVLAPAIDKQQIIDILQRGARGVVSKESAVEVLIRCIHSVIAGQYWVGRDSVASIVQALRSLKPPRTGPVARKNFGITPRELEIVTAVVAGHTNKDIAEKLSVSEQTVKHQLTNIFDKLGVSGRLELALFASNHSLVKLD